MLKKTVARLLILSLLLGMLVMPIQAAYSDRTPKAFQFLCDYAKTGRYHDLLQDYRLSFHPQQSVSYDIGYDVRNDIMYISLEEKRPNSGNMHRRISLEFFRGYWDCLDSWVDTYSSPSMISGNYQYAVLTPQHEIKSCDGNFRLLPKNFTGTSGFDFHNSFKIYHGLEITEEQALADAAFYVNNLLTLLDGFLKKGGYTVADLGFTGYKGHVTHTYWDSRKSSEPTCTEAGYEEDTCYICGAVNHRTVPALGHAWTVTEVKSEGTENEDGTFTHGKAVYTCTRCQETKEADYCGGELFTDMPARTNWAHNAIDWAVFNKITSGTSATTFAPGAGCTRAQVVTFLWRAAGEPEPEKTETGFTDLKPDGYYVKAVAWAVENGITAGVTKDRFAPNNTCTRAQIVTFLYRYENQPEIETAETGFSDVAPAAYYAKAVAWAVENNITAGVSADKFAPNNTCTRAQVVTFLYRDSKLVRPEPTPTPAPTGTPAPTQPTTPEEPTPVENPEDPTPVEDPEQPEPVQPQPVEPVTPQPADPVQPQPVEPRD